MNCYGCRYRGPANCGSVHSKCEHPDIEDLFQDSLLKIFSIFASVDRVPSVMFSPKVLDSMEKLGITVDATGFKNNWVNWPFDFDPIWILTCEGFTELPNGHHRHKVSVRVRPKNGNGSVKQRGSSGRKESRRSQAKGEKAARSD